MEFMVLVFYMATAFHAASWMDSRRRYSIAMVTNIVTRHSRTTYIERSKPKICSKQAQQTHYIAHPWAELLSTVGPAFVSGRFVRFCKKLRNLSPRRLPPTLPTLRSELSPIADPPPAAAFPDAVKEPASLRKPRLGALLNPWSLWLPRSCALLESEPFLYSSSCICKKSTFARLSASIILMLVALATSRSRSLKREVSAA